MSDLNYRRGNRAERRDERLECEMRDLSTSQH